MAKVPTITAGAVALRVASPKTLDQGDLFIDTESGRLGVKTDASVTDNSLLGHVRGIRYDQHEALAAKLDCKAGSAVMFVASDSTGDNGSDASRWPLPFLARIAALNTDAQVTRYDQWNDTAKTYTQTVVQAGTSQGSVGVKSRDAFNRTSADLVGSTADSGQNWTGSAANAAGDFSVSTSTGLTRSSDTTTAALLIDSGSAGDRDVTLAGIVNWSTLAATPASVFRLYNKFVDSNNNTYGYVNISTAGIVTWGITKTIGGTPTSQSGVGTILDANSGSAQTITSIKVSVAGTTATLTIVTAKGTFSATIALSSGDQAAIASGTRDGFQGGPLGWQTTPGGTNGFTSNVTAAAGPALTIIMRNAAITGSTLAAQIGQLTTMCPETPDLILINSVHNYNAASPATYLAALDQFINKCLSTWPNVGIAVMSQNPEGSAATNSAPHLARNTALRSYCASKGVGYIPVIEAFRALSDKGASLIRSDNIHPTGNGDTANAADGTAASNGTQLWTRVVWAWFKAKLLQSAPLS